MTQSAKRPDWRRERLLRAARAAFLETGFAGTTMEGVARRAQISKVTLYKHFADKQALFEAVVRELVAEVEAQIAVAVNQAHGAEGRIAAALTAKAEFFFTLLNPSPYAAEFHAAHASGSIPAFDAMEENLTAEVAAELRADGLRDAAGLARLLKSCAWGISQDAKRIGDIGPAVARVTSALMGAARV
ncbi:MAG: TetR/AcrR family transcriptional regulator [Hyphomicrobiaceae bacterium]|nr:TetR/AcrR family transcriptional regulator [Hyphomicrobiaceae bacterium]MCC0023750.1 TetR/AcrR family transcriptional regulator [Hyphomicrobiaceae bacterium]